MRSHASAPLPALWEHGDDTRDESTAALCAGSTSASARTSPSPITCQLRSSSWRKRRTSGAFQGGTRIELWIISHKRGQSGRGLPVQRQERGLHELPLKRSLRSHRAPGQQLGALRLRHTARARAPTLPVAYSSVASAPQPAPFPRRPNCSTPPSPPSRPDMAPTLLTTTYPPPVRPPVRSLEARSLTYEAGKPVVLMTWAGSDPALPSILLNSHTDVVPAERQFWTCACGYMYPYPCQFPVYLLCSRVSLRGTTRHRGDDTGKPSDRLFSLSLVCSEASTRRPLGTTPSAPRWTPRAASSRAAPKT